MKQYVSGQTTRYPTITAALCLANQREFDKAIDDYGEAIRLDGKSAAGYQVRANMFLNIGAFDKAIADCDAAIRLGPTNCGMFTIRAAAYSGKGDWEKAVADAEIAIELVEKSDGAHLEKAQQCTFVAYFLATFSDRRVWKLEQALQLARRATELAPALGNSWWALGVAEYRMGNYQAAVEMLTKGLELTPSDSPEIWLFLAMAHWQLEHKEDAWRWYDKAAAWMKENKPLEDECRFRAEAAELLGIAEKTPVVEEQTEKAK